MAFHSQTTGFPEAKRRMQRIKRTFARQDDQLFRQAGERISESISKNFEAEGRPKWTPRKYTYPWPILWKTGRMRARAEVTALTWIHQGRRHINRIYAPEYGIYHQKGTKRLPVRAFVGLTSQEWAELRTLLRGVLLKKG